MVEIFKVLIQLIHEIIFNSILILSKNFNGTYVFVSLNIIFQCKKLIFISYRIHRWILETLDSVQEPLVACYQSLKHYFTA